MQNETTAITVLLADDHAVVRKGIRDFLEEEPDMEVLAEAADGAAAKALIQQHQPDVAILDVRMPQASGIDVAAWVQEQQLPVRVLMLTSYDDEPYGVAAVQAGASRYVLKDAPAAHLVAVVRSVAAVPPARGLAARLRDARERRQGAAALRPTAAARHIRCAARAGLRAP